MILLLLLYDNNKWLVSDNTLIYNSDDNYIFVKQEKNSYNVVIFNKIIIKKGESENNE